jgi:anti-sigma factor RsiW
VTEHERLRTDLGAYLIGSLAPTERSALDRHLSCCSDCRAELATLAPLPGLLGRLPAADVRDGALVPDPALLPRILDTVRAEHSAARRRLRRWRLAAAAAGIVAVAALAIPPLTAVATPGATLLTAAGVTAGGSGDLAARPWGTAVALSLKDLPPAPGYVAYAVARDGHTQIAASWGATTDGSAAVTGATAIPRTELASVQVRTVDGVPLLTLVG